MSRRGSARLALVLLLAAPGQPDAAPEPEPETPPSALFELSYTPEEIDAEIDRIPGLLMEGSYDLATELLNSILPAVREDTARLRTAYLLLIKTHITRGNYFAYRLRERETAKLFYREADKLILEYLQAPALGGFVPQEGEDYPPEMMRAFERIRSENFGSFRILSLHPPHASVEVDGRFVPRGAGRVSALIPDLAVGPHEIVIRSDGHRTIRDEFTISPNSTLERSYALTKPKGSFWYLSRGAAVVAAGALTWILIDSGGGSPGLLPAPPGPPAE